MIALVSLLSIIEGLKRLLQSVQFRVRDLLVDQRPMKPGDLHMGR